MSAWIGVDLDGTLAEWRGPTRDGAIGAPVRSMVERVRAWLAEGVEVRIFTARVGGRVPIPARMRQQAAIESWCEMYVGRRLPVTAEKDFELTALYDDRAVRVETNTGRLT